MREPTARTRLLGERNFRLLLVGQSVSKLGSTVTVVAMPLVAISVLAAGPLGVAALTAMAWLPWVVFGLFAGVWADRFPPRPTMVLCDAVSAVALLSVPVAAWASRLTFGHLLTVALVAGTAAVFSSSAGQVLLPAVVGADRLVPANATLQGTDSAANVAGPGIAGLLAQAVGAVFGLLLDASSFVVSAVLLLAMRVPAPAGRPARESTTVFQDIADGFRFVLRDRLLKTLTVVAATSNLVFAASGALVVVFLVRVVMLPSALVGVVLATGGIGGFLGALATTRLVRAVGSARALLAGMWVTFPCGLLLPFGSTGPRIALVLLGYLLPGIGIAVCHIVLNVFRQTYCPPHVLGRVVATMRVVLVSTVPLGALLGGALGQWLGVRPALVLVMALLLAPAVVALASPVRGMRDLPGGPAAPGGAAAPDGPPDAPPPFRPPAHRPGRHRREPARGRARRLSRSA